MHAKSIQSGPTLGDPMDGNPPGSSVHGILQARVLEWGAISLHLINFSIDIGWLPESGAGGEVKLVKWSEGANF